MSHLVLVCGRKRHGKNTVADILCEEHGFQQIAFADPIKHILMSVCGLSYDECFNQSVKEVPMSHWGGLCPRQLMQIMGTVGRDTIDKDYWVNQTLESIWISKLGMPIWMVDHQLKQFVLLPTRATNTDCWVITDGRYPNEADATRLNSGIIVKVFRPGLPTEDEHHSENSIDRIQEDVCVVNLTGDLVGLKGKINLLVERYGLGHARNTKLLSPLSW